MNDNNSIETERERERERKKEKGVRERGGEAVVYPLYIHHQFTQSQLYSECTVYSVQCTHRRLYLDRGLSIHGLYFADTHTHDTQTIASGTHTQIRSYTSQLEGHVMCVCVCVCVCTVIFHVPYTRPCWGTVYILTAITCLSFSMYVEKLAWLILLSASDFWQSVQVAQIV